MLNDSDSLPVTCPYCGHETQKQIGWLKNAKGLICERCGEFVTINNDAFMNMLDNLRKHVLMAARHGGFAHKRD